MDRFRLETTLLLFTVFAFLSYTSAIHEVGRSYEFDYISDVSMITGSNNVYSILNLNASLNIEPLAVNKNTGASVVKIKIKTLQTDRKEQEKKDFPLTYIISWDENGNTDSAFYMGTPNEKEFRWNLATGILEFLKKRYVDKTDIIETIHGKCSSSEEHEIDKEEFVTFMRKHIWNCVPSSEHGNKRNSLAFDPNFSYEQSSNIIISEDGKTVESVDATEHHDVSLPFYGKSKVRVTTNHKLYLTFDSVSNIPNICKDLKLPKECVDRLKRYPESEIQNFNLDYLNQKETQHENESENEIDISLLAKRKFKTSTFVSLVETIRKSSFEQIQTAIKKEGKKKNSKIALARLANILAVSGVKHGYEAAVKVLQAQNKNSFLIYLQSLAHSFPYDWLIEDLIRSCSQNSLKEMSSDIKDALLRATASLIKRSCLPNSYCNSFKNKHVKEFIQIMKDQINFCEKQKGNKVNCMKSTLEIIQLINTPQSILLVDHLMCPSKDTEETRALPYFVLKIIERIPENLWPSKIPETLENVYGQRCGVKMDTSTRSLAAELILRSDPNLALKLLKIFQVKNSDDIELFSITLSKIKKATSMKNLIEALRENDLMYEFINVTIAGSSSVNSAHLYESADAPKYSLQMEFDSGVLKRSDLTMAVKEQGIFTFSLFSDGLESFVKESDPADEEEEKSPYAGMQLGLFESKMRPITFFNGTGELMSAVWGADGQPMTAHEGSLLLHDYDITLPLMNGLTLRTSLFTGVNLKISGSIEVSLWQRSSDSTVRTNLDVFTKEHFAIFDEGQAIMSAENHVNTGVQINFNTFVDFYGSPFKFCMKMDSEDVEIGQSFFLNQKRTEGWKRKYPGRSIMTNSQASRICSELEGHFS